MMASRTRDAPCTRVTTLPQSTITLAAVKSNGSFLDLGVMHALGGLVVAAVLVLAGCEEASAPGNGAPDPIELGIVGEWHATEYLTWQEADDGSLEQVDSLLVEGTSLTMTFTEDRRWVWTWTYDDQRLDDFTSSGTYELLSDSRIVLEYDDGNGGIVRYSVDATRLKLEIKSRYPNRVNVVSARRM